MRHLAAALALSLCAAIAARLEDVGLGAEVSVPLAGENGVLTVAVGSASSFRLSVRFGGWANASLPSPSLDASRAFAPSSPASAPGMAGLRTSFGTLLLATDGSGAWTLADAAGVELVASAGPPAQVADAAGEAGILLPVRGVGVADGPDRSASCLNNGAGLREAVGRSGALVAVMARCGGGVIVVASLAYALFSSP